MIDHLALLARVAPRLRGHRPIEVLLGDVDIVHPPDLGEENAEPHPALGDGPVFRPKIVLALAGLLEGVLVALQLLGDALPDRLELAIRRRFGDREIASLGQCVQQAAFQVQA